MKGLPKALRVRTRPIMDMTEEEDTNFWSLVTEQLARGRTVVLGQTRCPICGEELGPEFESRKEGQGRVALILNLCDRCWHMYHFSLKAN